MTAADTEPAAELLRRGGWGERLLFFDWALGRPTIDLFVAAAGGRGVATAVGSARGRVGWVRTIFVAPDRCGAGLGGTLTRCVIAALEARGCRSLVLIATQLGRPVYARARRYRSSIVTTKTVRHR